MLNSAVADVAVALIYVFVLVSVMVSALNEIVAGLLKQRAKALWHGIGELVLSTKLRDAFYAHPLIKSLAPPTSWMLLERLTGPSYIPRRTFALTILDVLKHPQAPLQQAHRALRDTAGALANPTPPSAAALAAMAVTLGAAGAALPATATGTALKRDLAALQAALAAPGATAASLLPAVESAARSLATGVTGFLTEGATPHSADLATILRILGENAAGDVERLRAAIEEWFDTGMDRVSGWYKRWTQCWQFGFGLVLAVALNVNVVSIANDLWINIPLRNAIVGDAVSFAKEPPTAGDATPLTRLDQAEVRLRKSQIDVGWSRWPTREDWTRIPGWLLTALGASFGAPFWFDLLNKFVQLRAGGPKPDGKKAAA